MPVPSVRSAFSFSGNGQTPYPKVSVSSPPTRHLFVVSPRPPRPMAVLFATVQEVSRPLSPMRRRTETLKQPGYVLAAFLVLNLVVFTETGLLVGFFLPGDSLLVVAGIVAHECDWSLSALLLTLCFAAALGDTAGYWIGYKTGPRIFN